MPRLRLNRKLSHCNNQNVFIYNPCSLRLVVPTEWFCPPLSKHFCLPLWPVRSSPCRALLRGWGQMGGRCGESDWRRLGATQIGGCPSSERWETLRYWSLAICRCCNSSWETKTQQWRGDTRGNGWCSHLKAAEPWEVSVLFLTWWCGISGCRCQG